MRKHLFLLSCLFLLSGSLFAQSTEPDKSNAIPEGTTQNATLDESAGEEGSNIPTVMAASEPDLISPETANPTMGREVSTGVDYYTGTGNVSVLLHTILSHGVNIPISVRYTASGVKYHDRTYTTVGTNWKMTGTGRITRVIIGEPDETGYLAGDGITGANILGTEWKASKILSRLKNKFDGQPDLYRFELPTGQSGAFVIDYNKSITLIPYQDIKVEWLNNDIYGNSYFVITDTQGVKYYFGPSEEYRQYAHNDNYERTKDFITDWLLERITYGEKEVARYTYGIFNTIPKESQKDRYYNDVRTFEYKASDNSVREIVRRYSPDVSPTRKKVEDYPKEVTAITCDLGKLEFVYDDPPGADLLYRSYTGPKLNHIKVYGYDNEYLKSIHVDIRYSGQDDNAGHRPIYGPTSKINRIYEKSGDKVRNICDFQYHKYEMSGTVDYWGYHAGDSLEQYRLNGKYFDSHYGKPKLGPARGGTLQKIIYATGGWTEFEYELHKGRLFTYTDPLAQQRPTGGLRVKSITKYESANSIASTTRYVYEDPNDREKGGLIMSDYKPGPRIREDKGSGSGRVIKYYITRKPDFPMTDFTGSPVVYNYVKEILPNGAYTTYEFTDFNSMMDAKGLAALSTVGSLEGAYPDWQYKVPYSTKHYGRGLLKKLTQYNSSNQVVYQEEYLHDYGNIKSTVNAYSLFVTDEETNDPKFYKGSYQWISQPVFLNKKITSSPRSPKLITEYFYSPGKDLLPREIVESYDIPAPDYFKTTITHPQDYSYNGTTTQGSEADGIFQLQIMGIKTMPIETIKYRKNNGEANWNVLGGEINIYKWNQTARMPVLEQTKSLIVSTLSPTIVKSSISGDILVKDSRYDTYNTQNISFNKQGNPEFIAPSGADSKDRGMRIIYGYDGHIPVGYITNTLQSSVSHLYCTSFEKGCYSTPDNTVFLGNRAKSGNYALKKGVAHNILLTLIPHVISYWRWDGNDNTTWEEVRKVVKTDEYTIKEPNHYVDEVRAIPTEAAMTTQVVKPGVGIISKTDEKGHAIRYEYNSLGMLESIAIDNKILGKYSYIDIPDSPVVEPTLYNLSAVVASGSSSRGQAFVSTDQVNEGGSATWSATAYSGSAFDHWEFSDGTRATTATTTKTNISRNITGTAYFKEKPKQPVNFQGTIMPRGGYWAINISCTPDIISEGVTVYATGYFFINPDSPDRRDVQFDGQVGEDGYILSNAAFNEEDMTGELNGTISFSDPNYTVGTVSWH